MNLKQEQMLVPWNPHPHQDQQPGSDVNPWGRFWGKNTSCHAARAKSQGRLQLGGMAAGSSLKGSCKHHASLCSCVPQVGKNRVRDTHFQLLIGCSWLGSAPLSKPLTNPMLLYKVCKVFPFDLLLLGAGCCFFSSVLVMKKPSAG